MKMTSLILTVFSLLFFGCEIFKENGDKEDGSEVLKISSETMSNGRTLLTIEAARPLFDEDAECVTTHGLAKNEKSRDFNDNYFIIEVIADTGLVEISLVNCDDKDDWADSDKLDGNQYWLWQDKANYKGIIALYVTEDGIETLSRGEYLDLKDNVSSIDTSTVKVDTVTRIDTLYNNDSSVIIIDTVKIIDTVTNTVEVKIPPSVLKLESSSKVGSAEYEYELSFLWDDSLKGDKPFVKGLPNWDDSSLASLGDIKEVKEEGRGIWIGLVPDGYHSFGYGGDVGNGWKVIRKGDLFVNDSTAEYPILGAWFKAGKIYPRNFVQVVQGDTLVIKDTIPSDTVFVVRDSIRTIKVSDTVFVTEYQIDSVFVINNVLDTITKTVFDTVFVSLPSDTVTVVKTVVDTLWLTDSIYVIKTVTDSLYIMDTDTITITDTVTITDTLTNTVVDTLIAISPVVSVVIDTSMDTAVTYQDSDSLTTRTVIAEVHTTNTITTSGFTDGGPDTTWTSDTTSSRKIYILSDNTVQNIFKLVSFDSVSADTFLIEVSLNEKAYLAEETEAYMYVASDLYSGPWDHDVLGWAGSGPITPMSGLTTFPVTVVVGDTNRVNFEGGSGNWADQSKLSLSGFFSSGNLEFIFNGTAIIPVP